MLLGVLLTTGGTGRPVDVPRPVPVTPAPATPAIGDAPAGHRAPVAVEAVTAGVTGADSVSPRPTGPQPLPVAVLAAVGIGALLAIRLRREQGSYTLPWGTGSTATRGPPALQPA
jgi:MYXO-CTERM domain-containing protein